MEFINLQNIVIFIFVYLILLIVLFFNKNIFTISFQFQSIILLATIVTIFFVITMIYYIIDYYYGDITIKINNKKIDDEEQSMPKTKKNIDNKMIPTLKPLKNIDNIVSSVKQPLEQYDKKEVYHIHNNIFTFDEAKDVCKSFNGELASLDQIKDAYFNGADWCNYGWSMDGNAYYPTQKNTYVEMQKNPKTKFNCGKPGINGGYFNDPKIRFGVNCYGIKPEGYSRLYPKKNEKITVEEEKTDKLSKIKKDLNISSWDSYKWSEYSKNNI